MTMPPAVHNHWYVVDGMGDVSSQNAQPQYMKHPVSAGLCLTYWSFAVHYNDEAWRDQHVGPVLAMLDSRQVASHKKELIG